MIVVSDTSPISNLILIKRLSILQKLFAEIIVPTAVNKEILALKQFGKDLQEYENVDWIKIRSCLKSDAVSDLNAKHKF
ncbi:MAG: hypothetical protein MUC29_05005 [Pyrinomonadaceae bacterium]|jgi:predicted nucleic acid-binding protein|nr:hypothetical protein [Pyrinomonadaceae bacterium]